jgi:hypothetical protein
VLVLDVQPGRDDFVASLRHWERYLRQPDVGVALDPEFAMGPARSRAPTWAGPMPPPSTGPRRTWPGIVRSNRLPEKLFMIHQFHDSMLRGDKKKVAVRPGLAMTWNADGFGVRSAKLDDYRSYTRDRRFHPA